MTLRGKLLLAQLPLAFSLLAVGVVSRRIMTSLDHNSQEILKDNYLSVLAAQRMRDAADAMGRIALAHAQGRKEAQVGALERSRTQFDRQLRFQEGNVTEPGELVVTE